MIENIVARAKKMAIKDLLDAGQRGIRVQHLLARLRRRVQGERGPAQHDEPRRLGPISGKKGERIVFIRTLVQGKQGTEAGRSIDTVANTGQYL